MRQRSAAQRIMGASSETQIPATASPQEATARAGSRAPTPGVVAALKFPGPAQIRVLTAPRKAAEEMAFSEERPDINIAAEGKSLSRSVALMGSDVAKILDGFGVKIINAKEKDSRKEDEIEWVEAKMKGTAPNLGAEDAVSKKEADKQKKLAIILALPGFILNSTEVLRGVSTSFSLVAKILLLC